MFTGLIEAIGRVRQLGLRGRGGVLVIDTSVWGEPFHLGESIAVQGTCLTLTEIYPDGFACDLLEETLKRTTIGTYKPGRRVNLERALRSDSRLGGHFVTGHIDGIGQLRTLSHAGDDYVLEIECSSDILSSLVPKGSITCDGISLTVADIGPDSFQVHIIPHTWAQTTLSDRSSGDAIHLETDIIGEYVRRHLEKGVSQSNVNYELLQRTGFVRGPS